MFKLLFKILLTAGILIIFLIPGYTFFVLDKNNLPILLNGSVDTSSKLLTVFRVFGLYAITLVWSQIVFGPFMMPLRSIYGPSVLRYHRLQGIFALTFATLHPLLFYMGYLLVGNFSSLIYGINDYFGGGELAFYGYFGPIAWTLMITTVTTAILARKIKKWRMIHLLNYLVFIFAFLHSYKIGSDVHREPLNTLYLIFGITFVLALVYRIGYRRVWTWWMNRSINPSTQ